MLFFTYLFYLTRLLGRFAPIYNFNCEHVLIVTLKNKEKNFADFIKKNADFKIKKCLQNKILLNTNL